MIKKVTKKPAKKVVKKAIKKVVKKATKKVVKKTAKKCVSSKKKVALKPDFCKEPCCSLLNANKNIEKTCCCKGVSKVKHFLKRIFCSKSK